MEPDKIYHIYNRGINGENLFKEERNYSYFLNKYASCITAIADTYAYCLLKNHFHLAVKIKSEQEIIDFYLRKKNINLITKVVNDIVEVEPNVELLPYVKIPDVRKIY